MENEILDLIKDYLPGSNRLKWDKIRDTAEYRRTQLLILAEILKELQKLNATLSK